IDVRAGDRARRDLVAREISETLQEIVDAVGMLRGAIGIEVLQLELELGQHVRVEELAQLGLAEQLTQLQRVDGERLRAALGKRLVSFVDEVTDVFEQERRRERRRRARV